MTARAPLAITAVVVVHNEERFVRRCLTSLAAVADEILVAHDGPCRDGSLDIAGEFTPHVRVHEWRGAPETHLIRLLRDASHDWILRLDCDEAFSPELTAMLRDVRTRAGDETITHYNAVWRAVYGPDDESPPRRHEVPNRTVLFRRSATRWVGIPHSPPRFAGAAHPLAACVYHYAPHQQYGLGELLSRKLRPFAKADAAIRLTYPVEAIGFDGETIQDVLGPVEEWRTTRPLLAAGPLAVMASAGALRRAFAAGSLTELLRNLRWPAAHGAYQLMLARELHRLRRSGCVPRLASAARR